MNKHEYDWNIENKISNEVNKEKYFGQFPWKNGEKLLTIPKGEKIEVGPGIKIIL